MSSPTKLSPVKVRAPLSAKRGSLAGAAKRGDDLQLLEFDPTQHLDELTELLKRDSDEEVRREFMYPAVQGRAELNAENVRRVIVHLRLRNEHAVGLRVVIRTSYSSEITVGHAEIVKSHSADDSAHIAKFYVSKVFRKRGYEEKALVAVVQRAFEFFSVSKLVVSSFESNEYFIKLLMQLGFRLSKAYSKSIIEQKRYYLVLSRAQFDQHAVGLYRSSPFYLKNNQNTAAAKPQVPATRSPRPRPHPRSLTDVKLPPIRYPITEMNLQSIKHVSFKLPRGEAPSRGAAKNSIVVNQGRAGSNGERHPVTFSTATPQPSDGGDATPHKKIVLMAPFFSPPKTRIHSQYPQYYGSSGGMSSMLSKSDTKTTLPAARTEVSEYMSRHIKVSKSIPKSYVRQYMKNRGDGSSRRTPDELEPKYSGIRLGEALSTRGSREQLPSIDGSSDRGARLELARGRNFSPAPSWDWRGG